MKYKKSNYSKYNNTLKAMSIGIFCGVVSCVLLLIIFSFVIVKIGHLSSNTVNVISFITNALGTFVAAYISLKILKKRGLVYGVIIGGTLFLFFTIIGFFLTRESFTLFTLIKLFIMIFTGALGGIISTNT